MSKHKMAIDNNHIILIENQLSYLFDSGSPFSTDRHGNAPLIQKCNAMGLWKQPIDGILGLDTILGNTWECDFTSETLLKNESAARIYHNAITLETSIVKGILFEFSVNGTAFRGILDTGAWIPYITSRLADSIPSCGTIQDSNPLIGDFTATLHPITFLLGNRSFSINAGKAPGALETFLQLMGVDCVLGITGLGFDAIRLDLKNNRLEF